MPSLLAEAGFSQVDSYFEGSHYQSAWLDPEQLGERCLGAALRTTLSVSLEDADAAFYAASTLVRLFAAGHVERRVLMCPDRCAHPIEYEVASFFRLGGGPAGNAFLEMWWASILHVL